MPAAHAGHPPGSGRACLLQDLTHAPDDLDHPGHRSLQQIPPAAQDRQVGPLQGGEHHLPGLILDRQQCAQLAPQSPLQAPLSGLMSQLLLSLVKTRQLLAQQQADRLARKGPSHPLAQLLEGGGLGVAPHLDLDAVPQVRHLGGQRVEGRLQARQVGGRFLVESRLQAVQLGLNPVQGRAGGKLVCLQEREQGETSEGVQFLAIVAFGPPDQLPGIPDQRPGQAPLGVAIHGPSQLIQVGMPTAARGGRHAIHLGQQLVRGRAPPTQELQPVGQRASVPRFEILHEGPQASLHGLHQTRHGPGHLLRPIEDVEAPVVPLQAAHQRDDRRKAFGQFAAPDVPLQDVQADLQEVVHRGEGRVDPFLLLFLVQGPIAPRQARRRLTQALGGPPDSRGVGALQGLLHGGQGLFLGVQILSTLFQDAVHLERPQQPRTHQGEKRAAFKTEVPGQGQGFKDLRRRGPALGQALGDVQDADQGGGKKCHDKRSFARNSPIPRSVRPS